MRPSGQPPALRVIQGALEDGSGWSWFCSQCAAAPSEEVSPVARVCRSCGMGVLLETRSDVAPGPEDAFLVVDSRLTVQALSRRAERLLGVREEDVIDKPVVGFLTAADTETDGPDGLMALLRDASTNGEELHSLSVRPLGAFGVRLGARIIPCGPPRAALVVLRHREPRRDLRIV
jgi:PAS domain-containing protein